MNRIYGRYVGSSLDSVSSHIQKHGHMLSIGEHLEVGDSLTKGRQGIFSGEYMGRTYTAIVEGKICEPGADGNTRVFGLLRNIRRGGQS